MSGDKEGHSDETTDLAGVWVENIVSEYSSFLNDFIEPRSFDTGRFCAYIYSGDTKDVFARRLEIMKRLGVPDDSYPYIANKALADLLSEGRIYPDDANKFLGELFERKAYFPVIMKNFLKAVYTDSLDIWLRVFNNYVNSLSTTESIDPKQIDPSKLYGFSLESAMPYIRANVFDMVGNMPIGSSEKKFQVAQPLTDGEIMYLPSGISFFNDDISQPFRNRDLTIYIAGALHEAGHIRRGSFVVDFTEFSRRYDDPDFFHRLWNCFDDVRIDAQNMQYFSGMGDAARSNLYAASNNFFMQRFVQHVSETSHVYSEYMHYLICNVIFVEMNRDACEFRYEIPESLENLLSSVYSLQTKKSLMEIIDEIKQDMSKMTLDTALDSIRMAAYAYTAIEQHFPIESPVREDFPGLDYVFGKELKQAPKYGNLKLNSPAQLDEKHVSTTEMEYESTLEMFLEFLEMYARPGRIEYVQSMPLDFFSVDMSGVHWFPEWNYAHRSYSEKAGVMHGTATDTDKKFVLEFEAAYKDVVDAVVREFRLSNLQQESINRRSIEPDEFNMDSVVEAYTDIQVDVKPSDNIYTSPHKIYDRCSVAILLDKSTSNMEPVKMKNGENKTKMDIVKYATLLTCEAINSSGDKFGVYEFCSDDYLTYVNEVKPFDEPYSDDSKARIGGIKPNGSNRDGAAIRYVCKQLKETESEEKILFLYTDGDPVYETEEEYDMEKKDRRAIEDVANSLQEAREQGIHVVYISVNTIPPAYLSEFAKYAETYHFVSDPIQIPEILLDSYRNILRR